MFTEDSFFRRHKILSAFLVLALLLTAFLGYRLRGPYRSYRIDFVKTGEGRPGILEVGVAMRDITPNLDKYDTYNDNTGNDRFEPKKGDTFNDRTNTGKFKPVWLAGFSSNRPAKGVNDPLWVRAIAFRNNGVTVVMVTIDSVGIFHEAFIEVRKAIDASLGIDHVMFSSTHNHNTPDTMGLWSGPIPWPWNFDHDYLQLVKNACKQAVEDAVKDLQPADMYFVPIEIEPEGLVHDSRQPLVYDTTICAARFTKHGTDDTIATMVSWGNHPETLGGRNPIITSDFCHWWRRGLEVGVSEPNGARGFGGMALYFQGMVGGLMNPLHITAQHRNGIDTFKEASFEKAAALGENLAIITANGLRGPDILKNENPRVAVAAKTIYIPVEGMFRYAMSLGFIHPGIWWGWKARTEINVIRIGDVEIITVPGEVYPEIFEGGIEAPQGQDFKIGPVEVPPIRRDLMKGKMNMVIGLANDEIGYIIPKSQWDANPPHAYRPQGQYGEQNSGGPEVAPALHRESVELLNRLHQAMTE